MPKEVYDLIIIGGGPAGLTSALYARRALLKTLLLEKGPLGGQVIYTDLIENYPGFPEGISGYDLIELMQRQVQKLGLEIQQEEATSLSDHGAYKEVTTVRGVNFRSKAVILALGAVYKKLGVPGELEFTGKGVSYCAICDGPFYRGKVVAVVGGGNTALQEALHLTKYAEKVYLIHRRDTFRATPILQERVKADPKIELVLETLVEEIQGNGGVERLKLKNVKTGEAFSLSVSGVFIFIGFSANTQWLKGVLDLDEQGFIITNKEMGTSMPGVFACGDCVSKKFRQIINACGEGAVAALNAEEFVKTLRP